MLRLLWPPIAYLALALLMSWPLARHLGDGLPGLGDALLQAWTIAWNAHALRSSPGSVWDAPIFVPYPDTLAFTDNHLLLATLTAPLTWASGEPLLAHNLLVLASYVLSGWAVFLLARDLLRDLAPRDAERATPAHAIAAFFAGAAFAFCAYRTAHMTQLNLLQTAWMVFALFFLRRLLRPANLGGGRLRDALLCGLFAGVQAVTALYYAFFTAALLGGYGLLWAVAALWARLGRVEPPPWRQLALALLAAGLAVALALPFTLPYARVFGTLAIVRSVQELDSWSAPIRAYISVTTGHMLYSRLGEPVVDAGEMVLFPGVLVGVLGLAGAGMILHGAARGFSRQLTLPSVALDGLFWPIVAVAAFVLSLGTGLRLLRYGEPLPFPTPYLLLYERLPGFAALRVPARWGLLVTLALAVLAALPLAAALARFRPGPRATLGAIALAVALAEQFAPPLTMPTGPALTAAPPVYAWLRASDAAAVLELPVAAVPRGEELERLTWRQWRGREHWRPLVASYSGLIPFGTSDLLRRAEDLPAEESLSFLRLVGVDTLVVHTDELDAASRERLLAGLAASPQARPAASVGAAEIFTLPADPRLATLETAAGPGGTIFVSADERLPGVAALALTRRLAAAGHPLYGSGRPRYYGPLATPGPGQVFAVGLLAAAEDPREHGFAAEHQLWAAHGIAAYRRAPALLVSLNLLQAVPGQFHPRYPAQLSLHASPEALTVGELRVPWESPPTALRLELDLASLAGGEVQAGTARLSIPPGLSTLSLALPYGAPLELVGDPATLALRRLRVLATPPEPAMVVAEPGLAASADASFADGLLQVEVRGAGSTGATLVIEGAAARDDRPVRLLQGSLALSPEGGVLRFAVDPLRRDAPWVTAGEEPQDGRYLVYLKDAERPDGPGQPVARFNLRGGQLVDFEAVPLPLTRIP
ncbi:MAG: hypothetical protein OHK0015_08620 [Chloroflexi bacterium OHK40]